MNQIKARGKVILDGDGKSTDEQDFSSGGCNFGPDVPLMESADHIYLIKN
jgi:hypothetical protein